MNWLNFKSIAVAIGLISASMASAATIDGLYNTGVDDAGNVLAIGTADAHYDMTGPISGALAVVPNPLWITAPLDSQWIGPTSGLVTDPLGTYRYALEFNLTGFIHTTALITGLATSDNPMTIFLNGVDIGYSNDPSQFLSLHSFSISSGFVSGLNTLTFDVTNAPGSGLNPSGLLVSGLTGTVEAASVVPLPSTGLLMLGAICAAMVLRRRRS